MLKYGKITKRFDFSVVMFKIFTDLIGKYIQYNYF